MRVTATLLLLLLSLALSRSRAREVTVDAAYRSVNGDLILISGDEYMGISPPPNPHQKYLLKRTGKTGVPPSAAIQAVVEHPTRVFIYYYGSDSSLKVHPGSGNAKESFYGSKRGFLKKGGPDAVGTKLGVFYVFRGCEYVTADESLVTFSQPKNITELDPDLPCDFDAAWTSPSRSFMTLLKGDEIWTVEGEDDMVYGPYDFSNVFSIWSWQLVPAPENRDQL